jgi:hypothetical protein
MTAEAALDYTSSCFAPHSPQVCSHSQFPQGPTRWMLSIFADTPRFVLNAVRDPGHDPA